MRTDKEIAELTRQFVALLQHESTEQEVAHLSILNLRVLACTYFSDNPPTMKEVAEEVGITLPSASVMVDRLEELGYVSRKHSAEDRRRVQTELTPKGRAIIEKKIARSQHILKKALAGFNQNDQRVVFAFFNAYIQAVEKELSNTPGQ